MPLIPPQKCNRSGIATHPLRLLQVAPCKHLCAAALSVLLFSTPALADNTEQCLQLYYMKSYAKALPFCTLSAQKGNSQSQYVLGLMYSDGLGVKKNKPEAIKWLRAASGQAYAAAHYKLVKLENEPDSSDAVMRRFMGKQRLTGTSIRPSGQKQKTTSGNQPPAAIIPPASRTTGTLKVHNGGFAAIKKQPKMQAPKNMDKPANAEPVMRRPTKPIRQITPPDDNTLYRQYRSKAKQGGANARFMLGLFYLEGRGVRQNTARATSLFKQAAKQGQAQAQFSLGLMYYDGRDGIMKNEKMAEHWLSKAAMQGLADAQYSLGLIASAKMNEEKAIKWWRRAAAQKYAKAQHNLAISYLNGNGVKVSRDKAAQWFIQEAEQGDPQTQFNLGRLYSEGEWLEQSGGDAVNWFYRAGETWVSMNQPGKARQSAEKINQLASQQHLTAPNLFLADVLTRQIEESSLR